MGALYGKGWSSFIPPYTAHWFIVTGEDPPLDVLKVQA